MIGFFDLRIPTKLVGRHGGHVGVHGVVSVSAALAALKGLRPSLNARLR